LDIGFIGRFKTRLVTTLNYSAIVDLHILQITTAHAKSFPACSVFTSSCLVTASNSGESSSASTFASLPSSYQVHRVSLLFTDSLMTTAQSQNYFTTGSLPPVLASSPLRPTTKHFFFQINSCVNKPYVTSSLTRRWFCLL
jgi:hypothetical protein